MRKTEIHSWCEEWGLLYKQEEVKLREILEDEVVDIDHIGSTSIPTIGYAKPIIDILVRLETLGKLIIIVNKWFNLGIILEGKMESKEDDILQKVVQDEPIMSIYIKRVMRILTRI